MGFSSWNNLYFKYQSITVCRTEYDPFLQSGFLEDQHFYPADSWEVKNMLLVSFANLKKQTVNLKVYGRGNFPVSATGGCESFTYFL